GRSAPKPVRTRSGRTAAHSGATATISTAPHSGREDRAHGRVEDLGQQARPHAVREREREEECYRGKLEPFRVVDVVIVDLGTLDEGPEERALRGPQVIRGAEDEVEQRDEHEPPERVPRRGVDLEFGDERGEARETEA